MSVWKEGISFHTTKERMWQNEQKEKIPVLSDSVSVSGSDTDRSLKLSVYESEDS